MNSKTSKEALEKVKNYHYADRYVFQYTEEYNIIKQDLDRLEKLEKVFSDLKSMFEIKMGIDSGNEYFIEIKQLDTRIAELIIPQEDIEIVKEVFEYDK